MLGSQEVKGGIRDIRFKVPSKTLKDQTHKMKGLVYRGKKAVALEEASTPMVTDPTDAVVRITMTTICGSDLHLYNGEISAKNLEGFILGHEAVGIVEDIGSEVKKIKKGDRVVISPVISCGQCDYCKRGEMSCCDFTNVSQEQKRVYGHNTGGLFGYSELFGGYDGLQADVARVPFADVNLFKIPEKIEDRQALMVSDIACTGFHGCELADVKENDSVVVFGCGPVGLMTQMWAKYRKAKIVIGIDVDEQRLKFAEAKLNVNIVNSKEQDPIQFVYNLIPGGPDKVIDCVGFRFPEGFLHKFERLIMLETDAPNILNAAIQMVRKNGRIALIGDYVGYVNHFNVGGFMEKHLTMSGGQLWPHRYYKKIFDCILSGDIDPSFAITHTFPLSQIAEVYDKFNKHEDGMIKPVLIPDSLFKL